MEFSIRTPLLGTTRNNENKIRETAQTKEQIGKAVECSTCKQKLAYPDGAFCIKCPKCSAVTAVQELSTLPCGRCHTTMVFPACSPIVQCTCGQVYSLIGKQ